jgi:hypothetical protein
MTEQEELINKLVKRVELLENQVLELQCTKNELYYQKYLEKVFGSTHKKTNHGITDITTNTEHIEIKHWRNYKQALGQLISYNQNDNKQLSAYFFGNVKDELKQKVVTLFVENNINVNEFIDGANGLSIKELTHKTLGQFDLKFIQPHIERSEDGFIKWAELKQVYIDWIVANYDCQPKIKNFKKFVETNIFKKQEMPLPKLGRGWKGWRLKKMHSV